ncbi:MAG: hypothetical protein SNJ69_17750, partial [Chloroflexaceae bacterium]
QYKTGAGQFQDYVSSTVDVSARPVLGAGESYCYPYEVTFTPVTGATYRNVARVTITNHSGWLPGGRNCPGPASCPFGPEPREDFSLPDSPTLIETDETAVVTDAPSCPVGFICTPGASGPWTFSGSDSVSFTTTIRNVSAPCDENVSLHNTATLTEQDSGQQRTASATVTIYTGPSPTGCTRTIGYWKTHAGFTGRNPDRVTPLLPVWLGTAGGARSVQVTTAAQAVSILNMNGDASNGINKLYAQLLAARLNIASGADGSAVASTIASADSFLASRNASDWNSLSRAQRQQVLAWMTTLDNYNNGSIGPGHCSP